jgi:hypothetical protein
LAECQLKLFSALNSVWYLSLMRLYLEPPTN